jgi:hypothetical protein
MCLDKHDNNPQNKHKAKYQETNKAKPFFTRNKELSNPIQGTNTQPKTQQYTKQKTTSPTHRTNNTIDRRNTKQDQNTQIKHKVNNPIQNSTQKLSCTMLHRPQM